uniref:Vacuolar protein-sorting-associated protein 36 n=1 Tax=Syphacia muris TaxID=451379 RepID=A0A158R4Q5_9BILA
MDRLAYYQPGECLEDILIQSGHVGIFDGDSKQTGYEQGTLSLTLHRVIWADSNDPDCRLVLHHSLVTKIERHHRSMFRRGGKIVVYLSPKGPGRFASPASTSLYNYIRFVFQNGGEDDFFEKYNDALARQTWRETMSSSTSSSLGSRSSVGVVANRAAGISGIERRYAENHRRTHETISQAFEDMSKLMDSARDMVTLSKNITEKVRARKGEISDDETIRFKSYLLSLGVSDPVTKATFGGGAKYYTKLAQELSAVLCEPLKDCGGMMTMPEAYCRVNRARGLELISPEDLLNACQTLQNLKLPITMHRFPSGVIVLQLREMGVETTIESTADFVSSMGSCSAKEFADNLGVTVVLAKERLLAAEEQAKLCRDDSLEGLKFFPNKFLSVT